MTNVEQHLLVIKRFTLLNLLFSFTQQSLVNKNLSIKC